MKGLVDGLIVTEDQALLRDAAARFVAANYPHRDWQRIVDGESGMCIHRWQAMAQLGWYGLGIPESAGGYGGSMQDTLTVLEALGAGLVSEPVASTVLICGDLIARYGQPAAAGHLIPLIVSGEQRLAWAHDEMDAADGGPTRTEARAVRGGWRLYGTKPLVADAPHAHVLLVSASILEDGAAVGRRGVFLVPIEQPGVSVRRFRTFDRRRVADVTLDGVSLPGESLLAAGHDAEEAIRRASGRRIAALAAEASGLAGATVDATREYLTVRKQFDVPLATFQVLQHQLVDLYIAREEIRTAMRMSAMACEASGDQDGMLSAVKVKVARAGQVIGRGALQLHGGMGMTDEMPVGDYMKRLDAIALLAGSVDSHLDRCAASGHLRG